MPSDRVYYVESTLGRGGFGTVYRARLVGRAGFSRAVALKVLNPDMVGVDEVARRLRDEARILGLVRHRAIVQVDSLVILDGRWTVVMELVEGVGLGHLIRSFGPLPPSAALEIAGEAAGALHAAWSQPGPDGTPLHILHRDIKPSNLRITPLGEVKVLDFGIARADFGEREAKTRSVTFGTVDYMSPERLDMEDLPAGDAYALGAVLFEMLTGTGLGRTSANPAKHRSLLDLAVERLRAAGISQELIAFITTTLDGEPENRPSARDFERACLRLRAGHPEPALRDWAEDVVPPLVAEGEEPATGEMSGSSFMEQGAYEDGTNQVLDGPFSIPIPPAGPTETEWVVVSAPSREPVEERPRPPVEERSAPTLSEPMDKRSKAPLLVILGATSLLLLMALGWALVRSREGEPIEGEPVSVAPAPTLSELPSPSPESVKEVEEPQASPAPVAAPKSPSPRPAPVLPVTAQGHPVRLTGDARSVVLVGPSGRHAVPGPVPAGSYRWEATFPVRGILQGGPVVVAGSSTLNCTEAFARCALR